MITTFLNQINHVASIGPIMMKPTSLIPGMQSAGKVISAMPPAAVFALRGGSTVATAAFDLTRARIRLEGLSAYGLIAVLLMNSALRLYTSVPKKIKDVSGSKDAKIENVATVLFTILSVVCILAGITTSIIYSLLGLYSKTALGMGNDQGFIDFFAATTAARKFGFVSMITSLLCLKGSFVMSTFIYFQGKTRYFLSGLTLLLSIFSWMSWSPIVSAASATLFA